MQVVHQTRPVVPRDRLVRLPEAEVITGVKKSTIYDLMRTGKFPRSVRLNARMVAWPETALLQWVQDRIADARSGAAQ